MMAEILRALANPKSNETIYIGHDSDLTGIGTRLDIGWSAPPFPDSTTAPGVGLRFETVKDSVSIQAVYTTFESDNGQLYTTPGCTLGINCLRSPVTKLTGVAREYR